ncbi:hypothetical protein ACOCJ7_03100 [Knoellia sp. CPCC 206453]|uniref:hypothetical protein n=1 Tax=Knoellia pratensis TaxID=3404796 RepID=UPI0036063895
MSEDCRHGLNPEWCASCRGDDDRALSPAAGRNVFGNGMQAQLDRLCRQLSIPVAKVGADGSLPVEVFAAAAKACKVKAGSMPETSALIASKSGLKWTPACDNRATTTGGATTVTREGLVVLNKAVTVVLASA